MDLHQVILKADFLMARKLIEAGASVNVRDAERRTPLLLCCLHEGESWARGVARMLLVHGGRVGLCDRHGRNALMYAVLYERLGLVKLFLQALDYDLNHTDKHGHTALWYADQVGNSPIQALLLQTMKRFGPSTDLAGTAVQSLRSSHAKLEKKGWVQSVVKGNTFNSAIDYMVEGHPSPPPGKCLPPLFRKPLPYKTLPADLWTKRASFYKTLKPPRSKPESKKVICGGSKQGKREKGQEEKTTTTPSPPKDWRLDMISLTRALENQISLSYRPRAQPRPPSLQPRRRTPRLGTSPTVEALLRQRRQRGRKMSLDAISDSLRKEKGALMGTFRRRCSVAVIPMIRLGVASRRFSLTGLEGRGGGGEDRGRGGEGRGGVGEGRVTPKPLVRIQEAKK